MKRFVTLIFFTFLALATLTAQIDKQTLKQVKQEVKVLQSEGWQPSFGTNSIEEQVMKVKEFTAAKDKDGVPIYIIVTATNAGMTENVATSMAYHTIKAEAAKVSTKGQNGMKVALGRCITLVKLQRNSRGKVEIKLTCAFKISDISISKEEGENSGAN